MRVERLHNISCVANVAGLPNWFYLRRGDPIACVKLVGLTVMNMFRKKGGQISTMYIYVTLVVFQRALWYGVFFV